jgi:hypothetical protein
MLQGRVGRGRVGLHHVCQVQAPRTEAARSWNGTPTTAFGDRVPAMHMYVVCGVRRACIMLDLPPPSVLHQCTQHPGDC